MCERLKNERKRRGEKSKGHENKETKKLSRWMISALLTKISHQLLQNKKFPRDISSTNNISFLARYIDSCARTKNNNLTKLLERNQVRDITYSISRELLPKKKKQISLTWSRKLFPKKRHLSRGISSTWAEKKLFLTRHLVSCVEINKFSSEYHSQYIKRNTW